MLFFSPPVLPSCPSPNLSSCLTLILTGGFGPGNQGGGEDSLTLGQQWASESQEREMWGRGGDLGSGAFWSIPIAF